MSAFPPDLIHRFITARKAATTTAAVSSGRRSSLFDGLKRRFSCEDHSIDPIEPGRPGCSGFDQPPLNSTDLQASLFGGARDVQ
jgi:hypothetical protein